MLFFVISRNWESDHYKKKLSFGDLVLEPQQLNLVQVEDKCKVVETGLIDHINYIVLECLAGIKLTELREHVRTAKTVESQSIEFIQLRVCECGDISVNTSQYYCEKCEKRHSICECGKPKDIHEQWCDTCDMHYSYENDDYDDYDDYDDNDDDDYHNIHFRNNEYC